MQTLLTEVVNLGDTSYVMAEEIADREPLMAMLSGREYCTDDNQRGYETRDTHLLTAGLRPFEVPVWEYIKAMDGNTNERRGGWELTNLMATAWEFRRFVPRARTGSGWGRVGGTGADLRR